MRAPIRGRRFRQRTRFIGGVVGFIASEQAPAVGTLAGVPSGTGAAVGVSFPGSVNRPEQTANTGGAWIHRQPAQPPRPTGSGTGAPARPTPEGGQPQPRHVQPKTTGKQATNNPKTSQKQPTDTANA